MTPRALAAEAARRILAELADDGVSVRAAKDAAYAAVAAFSAAADLDRADLDRADLDWADLYRAGRVLGRASELLLDEAGDGLDEATAADLAELATWGDK